jgi:hemin uptake protein HemP
MTKTKNLFAEIGIYLLFLLIALFSFTFDTRAQTVVKDSTGNYVAVRAVKSDTAIFQETGKTYTDSKGTVYNVMVSKNGKLFVFRQSAKTGSTYRQYLKL